MLKILSWNIQHRTGENLKKLIPIIIEKDADIVVLSEYRTNQRKLLEESLYTAGFKYQLESNVPDNKTNGLFIASKYKFTISNINYDVPEPSFRWLDIQLKDFNLKVIGVHIPDYSKSKKNISKKLFWQNLNNFAQKYIGHNVVIIGDFNTGLTEDTEGMDFECSDNMVQLNELGWIDSWRFKNPNKKEYTWYHASSKNGFRVDYAYVSPTLKNSILSVKHNHNDRVNHYSDHSSIMLELDIKNNHDSKLNEYEAFNIVFDGNNEKMQLLLDVYELIKKNIPIEIRDKAKFRYLKNNNYSNIGANIWNNKIFELGNFSRKNQCVTLIYPNNCIDTLSNILYRNKDKLNIKYKFKFNCSLVEFTSEEVLKFTKDNWNSVKTAFLLAEEAIGKENKSNISVNF